jgi:cytochrome c oxidase subunit 2
MEGIINLHHDLMYFIFFIFGFVFYILGRAIYSFDESRNPQATPFVHGTVIEILWTVMPSLILLVVAVPSFALLYSVDEVIDPAMTLKVVGHQWYWSYEYSDYSNDENAINFDSYIVGEEDLQLGHLRLLEVDNRVILPDSTHARVLVTAADVLHSWAVPSLGVKMDACPGRLNQTTLFPNREGVFYGQCSEICGVNHGFMPIVVESVDTAKYVEWLGMKIEE